MAEKIRRPREEVQKFVDLLTQEMPQQDIVRWHIGGSWARGSDTIADLDVMIVTETGEFGSLALPASFEATQVSGERVRQGILRFGDDELRVDLWAVSPREQGAFMLHINGPAALNIAMRRRAQDRGMKLTQYGLFNAAGQQIDHASEFSIFGELGMAFVRVTEREQYVSRPQREAIRQVFKVNSATSRDTTYDVVRITNPDGSVTWYCPCKAFKYTRSVPPVCKHIILKQEDLAEQEQGA